MCSTGSNKRLFHKGVELLVKAQAVSGLRLSPATDSLIPINSTRHDSQLANNSLFDFYQESVGHKESKDPWVGGLNIE